MESSKKHKLSFYATSSNKRKLKFTIYGSPPLYSLLVLPLRAKLFFSNVLNSIVKSKKKS